MPSKYRFRRLKRRFIVGNLAKLFNHYHIHPNYITLLMLIFAALTSTLLVATKNLSLFAIFLFITAILDGVDGTLARLSGKVSKFGGVLDSTFDRISEIIIFLGLFLINPGNYINTPQNNLAFNTFWQILSNPRIYRLIIIYSIFISIMISYLRSRASGLTQGDFDIGLMARSERLIFLVIITIFNNIFVFLGGLIIFSILITLTGLYRFIKFSSYLKTNLE
ncbi:MAG: CDP-alcohol phosphatidyltransferase family protein [Promethearchaeota archaeon]